MACAEADGWKTRVDVGEVVVMVRDMELARVLVSVVVRVSDQATLFGGQLLNLTTMMNTTYLPMIVELVP